MGDLRDAWHHVLDRPGSEQLASPDWPITAYLGSSRSGLPEFLIRSDRRLRGIELGPAVAISEFYRAHTSDWLLSVALTDSTLIDPFLTLAVDLLEHASTASTEESALSGIVSALGEWRRLLTARRTFSEEAIRGLLAELWYGFHVLAPVLGDDVVVTAWQRSTTAAQDFLLPHAQRHEVKALRPGGKTIQISSADQLDPTVGAITLATVELRDANPQDTVHGRTVLELGALVESVANRLPEPARQTFLATLAGRGHETGQDYTNVTVVPTTLVIYTVGPDFPSIRGAGVPGAVTHLTYALELGRISPWIAARQHLETV